MINVMKEQKFLMVFLIALAVALVLIILTKPLDAHAQMIAFTETNPYAKPAPILTEYAREQQLQATTTRFMTADAYRAQFATTSATTTPTVSIADLIREIAVLQAELKALTR